MWIQVFDSVPVTPQGPLDTNVAVWFRRDLDESRSVLVTVSALEHVAYAAFRSSNEHIQKRGSFFASVKRSSSLPLSPGCGRKLPWPEPPQASRQSTLPQLEVNMLALRRNIKSVLEGYVSHTA